MSTQEKKNISLSGRRISGGVRRLKRSRSHKFLFSGLIFGGLAFIAFGLAFSVSPHKAKASVSNCSFNALNEYDYRGTDTSSSPDPWNDPNYNYLTWQFILQSPNETGTNPPDPKVINQPDYITSNNCGDDLVRTNSTGPNSLLYTDGNGKTWAPIAARLGMDVNVNSGVWSNSFSCGGIPTATITRPLRKLTNCNTATAFVDDAGRATLVNHLGTANTLWNANITNAGAAHTNGPATSPPPGATDCNNNGDLYDYYPASPSSPTPNGAGAFMLNNLTPDTGNDWINDCGNFNGGSEDYTSTIDPSCSYGSQTLGVLCPFNLHMEAKSSNAPNIASFMIIEFKYPRAQPTTPTITPTPSCNGPGNTQEMGVLLSGFTTMPSNVSWFIGFNAGANGTVPVNADGTATIIPDPSAINESQQYTMNIYIVDNSGNPVTPPGVVSHTIGPCNPGVTTITPSCNAGQNVTASAPDSVAGSGSGTGSYTIPGDPTATPPIPDSTGSEGVSLSGTASFQSMTITYTYLATGQTGSFTTYSNPSQFLADNYFGFQGVKFTGTAYYSGPGSGTGAHGETVTGTVYGSATVTFSPQDDSTNTDYILPICVKNPQCASSIPGLIGIGRHWTMQLEVTYQIGPNGAPPSEGAGDTFPVSGGPGVVITGSGTQVPADELPYAASSTSMVDFAPQYYISQPGTYNMSWELTWPAGGSGSANGPTVCSGSGSAAMQPYIQVNGGDVIAGEGSAASCNGAGLYAWNSNDGSLDAAGNGDKLSSNGSGASFATRALGTINGFASTQTNGGGHPPLDTSFANTVNDSSSGQFGGCMNAVPSMPDYLSNANNATVRSRSFNGALPSLVAQNDAVRIKGPATISASSFPGGKQLTMFVSGDVYITGSITYNQRMIGSGGPANITSFQLIASGNIYIEPGATQLDGAYISQGGNIYTCSSDGTFPGFSACHTQLVVNGALDAITVNGSGGTIKFWRTYGTLSATPGISEPHAPAETINYSPAIWLAEPTIQQPNNEDAITSLPPIL